MIKQLGFNAPSFAMRSFGFGVSAYDAIALFASGQQGVLYEPWDLATLYQDAAGTVPVTANGDPVRLMLDKSGNGNHAVAPSSSARPIYQTDGILHRLKFDGVDDCMSVPTLNLSAYNDLNIFAAVSRSLDSTQMIAEFGGNTLAGSFYFVAGNDAGVLGWTSLSRGSADLDITASQVARIATTAPETSVLSVHHSIPNDLSTIRRNQVAGINATGDKGLGNFGNYPLYIGSRAGSSLFFNNNLYGLLISTGSATINEVTSMERYLADKSGVTL